LESAVKARVLAVMLAVGLLAATGLVGGQALAQGKGPTLKSLVRQAKALPRAGVPKAKKRRLVRVVRHAGRVAKKRPCVAVRDLNRFRRILGTVKVKGGRRARNRVAAIGPASLTVSRKLLARKGTKRCGGGVKPSTRNNTSTRLLESDENGMRLRIDLPEVKFVPRTGGGQTWSELKLPNTDTPSAPGTPGIPVASSSFGIPDGATLDVDLGKTQSVTLKGVDVFPAQPDVVDQSPNEPRPNFFEPPFEDAPFTMNKKAYDTDSFVPARPADADALGAFRDLNIGGLQIPAAQYNASNGTLKILKTVNVTVNFNGGPHTFSSELNSPWEKPMRDIASSLLNGRVIFAREFFIHRRCGEEMMVITNPATRAAADQFADGKRAQGMRTTVFETGTGTGQIGTTAAAIQTFIRGRLNRLLCIHPSYVTIMGDDDLVPTFAGINGIPSDLPYSMRNDTDELPDVAVGRFIGNDQAAIATAVTKVLNYENSPPAGPMLGRATLAAQFQDDNLDGTENRTFITFAETVRRGLVQRGVAVDRIYDDSPTATPQRFNDGSALPNALLKPGFAWDGDGADVTAAWNEGRFLMVHRDHGWSDGWGHPGYTTTNVQALTNGALLPVVMSINCSSAAYDYDETSFVGESLVKPNGGSVGAFGDTRDSPSWHNTQIALGFVDGLLPSVLPSEGPANKQRVGNALITGKLRLAGLSPPASDGSTRNELYLWHYFGDPSMQMWGGGVSPLQFILEQFRATYRQVPQPGDGPPYEVNVTLPNSLQGQSISLLRNGEVIGKAIVGDGVATIPAAFGDGSVKPGELEVALDADGAAPIKVPVTEVPKGTTSMTQTCPEDTSWNDSATVSGTLSGAEAGATVTVTWTRPDGRGSFDRAVTTDSQGNWTDTIDTGDDFDPGAGGNGGTWQVRASYAGDAAYAPSSTENCSFFESGS
jgi:hypothetical protein